MNSTLKWVPGKGYEKECQVCSQTFYGRLNKSYCSTHCKSQHSNGLARELREMLQIDHPQLRKNIHILAEICKDQLQKVIIRTKDELHSLGFNGNAYTALSTVKGKEGKWMRIGSFLFQIQTNDSTIKIIKYR